MTHATKAEVIGIKGQLLEAFWELVQEIKP